MDYANIPVLLQNHAGTMIAKVDRDDYQMVMEFASVWRLTTNGYARTTKKVGEKFKMFYMHSLIFGDRARHVNGDRLDNRRQNLVAVTRKKRIMPDDSEQDFKISRPTVISEEMVEFQHDESTLLFYSGYAIIHYRNKKHYSGLIVRGIPQGFGTLYEQEAQLQSLGMWDKGKMVEGMVLHYRPLPSCVCQTEILCPLRVVDRVEVVKGGIRVT